MASSRAVRAIHCALPLLLAGAATGCLSKAAVSVKYADNFDPTHHKVSIFGVFKDGRMNSEAWGGLAPQVRAAFGGGSCEAGYGAAAFPPERDVTTAIDEYATSNGPTDDLLGQIAPAAMGDVVLVLTVAGHLPVQKKVSVQDAPIQHGAGNAYGPHTRKGRDYDPNELQLAAQFFSVAQGRSVAVANIDYTGESVDEAMSKFQGLIAQALPQSECAGWKVEANLDAAKIRSLGQ